MNEKTSHKEILWPVLLILMLVVCFLLSAQVLWRMALNECYREIEQADEKAAATLQYNFDLYRGNLELAASLLTREQLDDPVALQKQLAAFCVHQQLDALCIQFPNGSFVSGGSTAPDYSALPSFEEISARLPSISGRFPGVEGSGQWFLYQAVPVRIDGRLEAVLYGMMNLDYLPILFAADLPYGGQAQLYLVDGDTGDFLMDMWHDSLGNIYDGSMGSRITKPGYSLDTMLDDIRSGRSGYFVFLSQTAGEYFYTRYQPAGINNWSINLTVLESVAFAQVRNISLILFLLGGAVTVITAAYLVITFRQYHRRLQQKQAQIQQTTFMFEVQQTLFDTHQDPALMEKALQKVALQVSAEGAFLLSLHQDHVYRVSIWRRSGARFRPVNEGSSLPQDFPQIYQKLVRNQSVLYRQEDPACCFSQAEQDQLRARQIDSIMISPVLDTSGRLFGILCAVNFPPSQSVPRYLECVVHSFMMAMCNIDSYQLIHHMGTMDSLTGIQNRNSYEAALDSYASAVSDRMCCIYIDVNGLHELNNQQGHKAGDTMLCFVAEQICAFFGSEHTYRIGGDEFVAFSFREEPEAVRQKVEGLRRQVEQAGYNISIGCAFRQESQPGLEALIARAETEMYADKKAFYARSGLRAEPR